MKNIVLVLATTVFVLSAQYVALEIARYRSEPTIEINGMPGRKADPFIVRPLRPQPEFVWL
jgi:hypothetical protein